MERNIEAFESLLHRARMALRTGFEAHEAFHACASPGSHGDLRGTRTVFHNPFATMERLEHEMHVGVFLLGRGRAPFDRAGNPIRLRSEERRAMRDRAAAVRSAIIRREGLEKKQTVLAPLDAPPHKEDGGAAPGMDPSTGAPPIAVVVSLPAPPFEERGREFSPNAHFRDGGSPRR